MWFCFTAQFLFKMFSNARMRPKKGFLLLLACVCVSIHLTTHKNMCISIMQHFFSYECTDVHYTSTSPIEPSVRKNPTGDTPFALWSSNDMGNYTDLPLPPFPLSSVGIIHRRKKISSVHQILFQIMLSETSASWEGGWRKSEQVKNEKPWGEKREKNKSHWKLISTNAIAWKLPVAVVLLWFPGSKNLHSGTLSCSIDVLDLNVL